MSGGRPVTMKQIGRGPQAQMQAGVRQVYRHVPRERDDRRPAQWRHQHTSADRERRRHHGDNETRGRQLSGMQINFRSAHLQLFPGIVS
jgi:hypothetical protein